MRLPALLAAFLVVAQFLNALARPTIAAPPSAQQAPANKPGANHPAAPPAPGPAAAVEAPKARFVRLKDISTIEGIRDNLLVGYGLVVGLNGTGDRQQTFFPLQTLSNILQKMGMQISVTQTVVKNIAAVFVEATLPPFARPGTRIDATVGSVGDAKSLDGGVLVLTSLYGANGQAYAEVEGPLALGGYMAGARGNLKQVNQPTVGRIPNGAIVERNVSPDLTQMSKITLLLRDPDYTAAQNAAAAINRELGRDAAHAVDGSRVEFSASGYAPDAIPALLARVGNLSISVPPVSKVVVNERTGTIVMGSNASLGACSVMQGSLAIDIATQYAVSQPEPLSKSGQTVVVPETNVETQENPAQVIRLQEGATVEDLVKGLQAIGATAHDIVAILQAIKAAGALQADLEAI